MSSGRIEAGDAPRVAVVIVTYRSAAVIEDCLSVLEAALHGVRAVAVVVADNASPDDTVERARRVRPDAVIVPTGANLGYAAAINAGVAVLPDHDHLVILNPDTELCPGSVACLVAALDDRGGQHRGIAVPRFESADGHRQFNLRREPTLRTATAEMLFAGGRDSGETVRDAARYERPGPVDWATGAALVVSRACAKAVGDWDESFLLYSEETDYMLRARDAGFLTWYVPDAVVRHRGGESAVSPWLWSLVVANKVRLFSQRHGRSRGAAYRLITLVGQLLRAVAGQRRARAAVVLLVRRSRVPTSLPG